jgi:hypothetical protein
MDVNGKTEIVVTGITDMNHYVPIKMEIEIKIYELNIDLIIRVDKPHALGKWDDHPFNIINRSSITNIYKNRITKTRSTLTMLSELITPIPIYNKHTTDCTHRAQLIAALDHFWD